MKKIKTQKGITLVALVITIIVLLILAVVAIGAVRDSGIIGHAQNSADRYNTGKAEEESMLGQYEDAISQYETEGKFETNGDGNGEVFPGEEIVWAYYYYEEYQAGILNLIGNVEELVLDPSKEVQAYKIIQDGTILNDRGEEEPKYIMTNEIVTTTMEGQGIDLGNSDFIDNTLASIGKLIIKEDINLDMLEMYQANIKSIKFEEGIESLHGVCYHVYSITSVEFPSTLKEITGDSFYMCENLTSIKIPASVTFIDGSAFYQSTGLETIYYEGTKAQWESNQLANTFNKYDSPNLKKVIFSDGTEAPVFSE